MKPLESSFKLPSFRTTSFSTATILEIIFMIPALTAFKKESLLKSIRLGSNAVVSGKSCAPRHSPVESQLIADEQRRNRL